MRAPIGDKRLSETVDLYLNMFGYGKMQSVKHWTTATFETYSRVGRVAAPNHANKLPVGVRSTKTPGNGRNSGIVVSSERIYPVSFIRSLTSSRYFVRDRSGDVPPTR